MDTLHLESLQFFGRHGTEEWEKETGRRFEVDVILHADMSPQGQSDRLDEAYDYRSIYAVARKIVEDENHELIERMAWRILEEMFGAFKVDAVTVRVAKPEAPIGGINRVVRIEYHRKRGEFETIA